MASDFLARIKLALEGKEATVAGLKETQQAAQKLASTKITTTFDKTGAVTGKQIQENFKNISDTAPKASAGMNDFTKALNRAAIVAPVWLALRGAMMGVMNLISSQVKFLKDLEDAMARIKIVGRGTEEEFANLKTSLLGLSMSYGVVASSALEAAVIFAQQGKSVEEVIKLTRIAMIGAQVLGTDVVSTVDNMTAAVNAFNIPIEDSINIINKWINVEKQFAVTAKDLADATKVSGATANQMGVSINAFLGDVTSVIEVTRKSGAEAGRALSFIYARLLTTGKTAIQGIAKVPIYLDAQNKAAFGLSNTYRSVTDILDDVAATWGTLTNAERLNIAENVASKRQLTVFMALMQNYTASFDARLASINSAGSAEKAFAIIQDTLSFKLNQSASAWNNLTVSIGDTSAFKGVIDVITELVNRWAALVNIQQAYLIESKKIQDEGTRIIETQVSQKQAMIDLINMRNEYLTKTPNDKNKEALTKIDAAITALKANSGIEINVDDKNAVVGLTQTIDMLRKQAIRDKINIEFDTKKNVLEKQMADIKDKLRFKPGDGFGAYFQKGLANLVGYNDAASKIKDTQKQINNLKSDNLKQQDAALSKYELEAVVGEAARKQKQQEYDDSKELLDIEAEEIDAVRQLNLAKQSGVLTNQQILDLEIQIADKFDKSANIHEKAIKLEKLRAQAAEATVKDIEKQESILSSILKIYGVQESIILRQDMVFKAMMYGENYIKNSMEDRVKLAQALTKEADEQDKKSSHMVELFKIAKKYGQGTAQEIAQYQGGNIEFGQLSTKAQGALKKENAGVYEQGQAEQYFAGQGQGFTFPEQIAKERTTQRNIQIMESIAIEPIQLNVDLNADSVIQASIEAITAALEDKKSDIYQAIDKQIENK